MFFIEFGELVAGRRFIDPKTGYLCRKLFGEFVPRNSAPLRIDAHTVEIKDQFAPWRDEFVNAIEEESGKLVYIPPERQVCVFY